MVVIMKNSNTRAIIQKNQNHMIRQAGGIRNLMANAEAVLPRGTPYQRFYKLAESGEFLIYSQDIRAYLKRLGYTEDQLKRMDVDKKYFSLMARDGARLYEARMKSRK